MIFSSNFYVLVSTTCFISQQGSSSSESETDPTVPVADSVLVKARRGLKRSTSRSGRSLAVKGVFLPPLDSPDAADHDVASTEASAPEKANDTMIVDLTD